MHEQMDPNFIPCTFLRPSFILLLIKRENRKVVRKSYKKENTKRKNKGKPA